MPEPATNSSSPAASSEPTVSPVARYPLQLSIAVVFTLLIAALGIALVWHNYAENRILALNAANDLFARVTRETAVNVRALYAPAEALVDITAQLEEVERASFDERMALFGYFVESLRIARHVSSLYVADADGDFFLVRALRGNARIAAALGAPEGTQFLVLSVERDGDQARETYYYYDDKPELIRAGESIATDYDPRQRIWYEKASTASRQIGSGFYVFSQTGEVGTTIARRTPGGRAVVAADLTLRDLSVGIAQQRITPTTEIVVFNAAGGALAYPDEIAGEPRAQTRDDAQLEQVHITDLTNPVFDALYRSYQSGMTDGQLAFAVHGRDWLGSISQLPIKSGNEVYLAILVPQDELLAGVNELRTEGALISLALLLVAIAVAWWIARRIAHSLRILASEAERIRELKLDTPVSVHSRVLEVDDLAATMSVMKSAIQQFVETSKALSAEKDFDRLIERILGEARAACGADGGGIFLFDDESQSLQLMVTVNERSGLRYGGTSGVEIPWPPLRLQAADGESGALPAEAHAVRSGETTVVDDVTDVTRLDFSHMRQRYERGEYRCCSLLLLPLHNRQGETIGVLELVNAREVDGDRVIGFSPEVVSYVEAMSSQAAITLDNQRLLKAQKDLLDAFIQLIAGAIDAKSPYTSGHCQRVPELARMLARAAHDSDDGRFADFRLNDDEWYELHIASWLHDCGKVTTPEYVVDKATKLECIYNRIHEIRMRFEVLWRDAQIAYYQALAEGGAESAQLQQQLDAQLETLREEFAFVAECNEGGEFMAPERVERLREIGARTWLRHFDDRIGLSQDEQARKQLSEAVALPARETLLADKAEHIVPRDDDGQPFGDNPHGFRMQVPEHAFNLGELYNLGIARGTLTDEDRFKINEHIVQTIVLLNKLPFPRELRRVPTWAGNHHEKLDGTGYPRRLAAGDLSVPERIMAIADIFEALTASDRPYKKAKTLSESIRIMSFMRKDGHVCPELFDLFLSSGVYRDYAREFLAPAQIDEVDVAQYLDAAKA